MDIERARHEPTRSHRSPVTQLDPGRLPPFQDDPRDIDLRLECAACSDERLHKPANEIERASLTELIAALEIECADDRSHGTRFRHGIREPCPEQRHLE